MIIVLEGDLGSGKTVGMVRYLYKDCFKLGNNVVSNMKGLKFGRQIDIFKIMGISEDTKVKDMDIKKMPTLNNISIGIDEITVFMDCRRSQSKMNLLMSYFILQTRKRNVQLYATTQDLSMVDLRLWKYVNMIVICDFTYDDNGDEVKDWRHYTVVDKRKKYDWKLSRFKLDISKYYELYDTNEVVLPPI